MTDGNTLIVDVIQKGDDYILNDTPVNMMIAYEVVRRHVTDNGTFYSQMTMKQKTAEGYVFKFDTGDEFTCTSDTAYPTAESVSDETGGGSGGGVFEIHASGNPTNFTFQETFSDIYNAFKEGKRVFFISSAMGNKYRGDLIGVNTNGSETSVKFTFLYATSKDIGAVKLIIYDAYLPNNTETHVVAGICASVKLTDATSGNDHILKYGSTALTPNNLGSTLGLTDTTNVYNLNIHIGNELVLSYDASGREFKTLTKTYKAANTSSNYILQS